MSTSADQIEESIGRKLIGIAQSRGFVVLVFDDGKRYQIYACGKVNPDYSAHCWLGVEQSDAEKHGIP